MTDKSSHLEEIYLWIQQRQERLNVLKRFFQPVTISQLKSLTGYTLDQCRYVFFELATRGIINCLTPLTRKNHIFWLTSIGLYSLNEIRSAIGKPAIDSKLPEMDWALYSWACYTQRSMVIACLEDLSSPKKIRLKVNEQYPRNKLSISNTRDVLRALIDKGLVRKNHDENGDHPKYSLTQAGRKIQALLLNLRWENQ